MPVADLGLAALLKRDRLVVAVALTIVTLLAWAYVLRLAASMAMPADTMSGDMGGMDMSRMADAMAPAFRAWGPADFAYMFVMWSVMMVGMMTPSVAPMLLLYAGVGRTAAAGHAPFASTGWFFGGYLAAWIAFSALATLAQWALTSLALLSPMMAATSTVFGGLILVAVGFYQWSPLKETCVWACQAPLAFLMQRGGFRPELAAAFSLGLAHGAYCLGCCIGLMALLFVGGVMNVFWIFGLTILVLLEKLVPTGRLIPRISGAVIAAVGVVLLVRGLT